jgi:outer membrane lipoprotein SlyB
MVSKLALGLVNGAAVNPTIGAAFNAVEDRIKRMVLQREFPQVLKGSLDGALLQGIRGLNHGLHAGKRQSGLSDEVPDKAQTNPESAGARRKGAGGSAPVPPAQVDSASRPSRQSDPHGSGERSSVFADKLSSRLELFEVGVDLVGIYRSDQSEEEKANGYGEVLGRFVGSRLGAAVGTRFGGPVGKVLGEVFGGMAGEHFGPGLAKRLLIDQKPGKLEAGFKFECTSVVQEPGVLVLGGVAGKPHGESFSRWMAKNWFAPQQPSKPSTVLADKCKPCPCVLGETVRCVADTAFAAPAAQAQSAPGTDSLSLLGAAAITATLPRLTAQAGRGGTGSAFQRLGSGVLDRVKGVFGSRSARKAGPRGATRVPFPLADPPAALPGPSVASRMWTGVKSVARMSVLEAGIKALLTATTAETTEQKADGYGGAAGGLVGALAGAAAGSLVVPVIGTAVGALVGGIMGDKLGSKLARYWFAPDAGVKPAAESNEPAKPLAHQRVAPEGSKVLTPDVLKSIPMLGSVTCTLTPSAAPPELTATLPRAELVVAELPAQINQHFNFSPNMPVTVQGGFCDPMLLAQNLQAMVRREFEELMRMATARQLSDIPHVN